MSQAPQSQPATLEERGLTRRKWTARAVCAAAGVVFFAIAGSASAQLSAREFPANARYGEFHGSAWPIQPSMLIGRATRRTAPGFVARGPQNEKLASMPSGEYAVAWAPDTQGQILRLWILTSDENRAMAAKYGQGGNTE